MHVVIMGCGRVGAALAHNVETLGHTVAVIDRDASAFRRLGPDYRGQKVHGVGFARETLELAGTQDAGAFAAVSSGDNSNIVAARVARETFGVVNVAARIYDPRRALIYQRLGIPTVATVSWSAEQMQRLLIPPPVRDEWHDSTGTVQLAAIQVNDAWVGQPLSELESAAACRVAYLLRYGEGLVPDATTVVQEGDAVHVMVRLDAAAHAAEVLGVAPSEAQ